MATILNNAALEKKINNWKNYFAKIPLWQLECIYQIMVATALEVMDHNLAAESLESEKQGAVHPVSTASTKEWERPGFKFTFQNLSNEALGKLLWPNSTVKQE